MQLIRGLHNLKEAHLPSKLCITIGNYDGIHLGHQKILDALRAQSLQTKAASMAIIFEPQPREYFAKEPIILHKRLMNLHEKLDGFAKYGIEYVLCLRFNKQLLNLSAEDFVKNILIAKLHMQDLVIGEDFAFGKERTGDLGLIKKLSGKYHFNLIAIPPIIIEGQRVSSTLIRNALANSDLELARKFLGHNYSVCGRVIHGIELGRTLDFPTANIQLHHKAVPLAGVYAVYVHGIKDTPIPGIANIGFRPTIGIRSRLLEVYLFNFNENIYGKLIRVEFIKHIRNERKFHNLKKLKMQITKDVEEVKDFFKGIMRTDLQHHYRESGDNEN